MSTPSSVSARPSPHRAFTLIELLLVVAIIAILAAIAIPNMLEAQVRAKVARVKSDLRTVATATEAYMVDANSYPPGYGVSVNGRNWGACLTTPIAYITSWGPLADPFGQNQGRFDDQLISYEGVNGEGHVIEQPNTPPYTVLAATAGPTTWWWTLSRGPDTIMGFNAAGTEEGNIRQYFYESDALPDKWLGILYDPTNGTTSIGNIYRAGGSISNYAGRTMGR